MILSLEPIIIKINQYARSLSRYNLAVSKYSKLKDDSQRLYCWSIFIGFLGWQQWLKWSIHRLPPQSAPLKVFPQMVFNLCKYKSWSKTEIVYTFWLWEIFSILILIVMGSRLKITMAFLVWNLTFCKERKNKACCRIGSQIWTDHRSILRF